MRGFTQRHGAGFDDTHAETLHRARLALTLHRGRQGGLQDTDALSAIRVLQRALADQPLELSLRIELGERALALAVDADDRNLLDARWDHAQALGESGKLPPAIAVFEVVLADQTRILGADHPDTLRTRHNLASWFAENGEIETALEGFDQLIADATRILGTENPQTLKARSRRGK